MLFTSLFIDNRPLLFISVIVFVGIVLALVLYKDPSSGLQEELLTLQQSAGGRQSEEAMSVRYELEKDEEIRKLFERESYKLQQMERAYDKVVSSYEEWERETFRTSEQVNVYKSVIRSLNFIRMRTYCRRLSVWKKCSNYIVN